jgi:CubicO group peptidase (beta-lactamase class C family)
MNENISPGTKHYMKKILLFLLFILFHSEVTHSQDSGDFIMDKVDSLYRVYSQDTTVGTAIGIIMRQDFSSQVQTWKLYYGQKNRTIPDLKPDSTTVFQIGSNTKTFTAALLAYLVYTSQVKLTDLAKMYWPDSLKLPYWVQNGDTTYISILDLATHYSGFIDEPAGTVYPYQLLSMMQYLDTTSLFAIPDSIWTYSNLGFATLATAITIKAQKDSIEKFIIDNICDSLNMPDTRITLNKDQVERQARGYIFNNSQWHQAAMEKNTWPAFNGAGALRSTINDMMEYLSYNLGLTNSGLNPLLQILHARRRPVNVTGSVTGWQGLAWEMHHLGGNQKAPWVIWKDGGTPGFSSYIAFYTDTATDHKAGVVVLTNSGNAGSNVQSLSNSILELLNNTFGSVNISPVTAEIPLSYKLYQNYPNPFNPSTKIRFDIPETGNVEIKVFDISGKEISELLNKNINPGTYELIFNGNDLSSGIYFYRMKVNNEAVHVRKMILLR